MKISFLCHPGSRQKNGYIHGGEYRSVGSYGTIRIIWWYFTYTCTLTSKCRSSEQENKFYHYTFPIAQLYLPLP